MSTNGWSALFLPAASPGKIIRYLERRRRMGEAVPEGLLLSDAAGPERIRALIGPNDADVRAWMHHAGPALSEALEARVAFLASDAASPPAWEGCSWEKGKVSTTAPTGENTAPPRSGWQRLLTRWARSSNRSALPPPLAWAHRQRLPYRRIPQLSSRPIPRIEYRTVARLDQKSLLVEDSPRLYQFELPPPTLGARGTGNAV